MKTSRIFTLVGISVILFSISLAPLAKTPPQKMTEADVKAFLEMAPQQFGCTIHRQQLQNWNYAEAKIPIGLANCADCAPYITVFRERGTNGMPTVGARVSWSTLWKIPSILVHYAKTLPKRGWVFLRKGFQKLFS
ncbi:MAG: hypothetical protein OXH00_05435 [Candidatus Poribacteria bacterium]|nr:hypothetical protein [Candidatus Poribacteria bacterium]